MKKRRYLCGAASVSLAAVAILTLALNLLTIGSSCFWQSDRADETPKDLSEWEKEIDHDDERVDNDVADLESRLLSSQEEVARLRRQILGGTNGNGADVCNASPRDSYKPTARRDVIEWDSFDEKYLFSSFMNGESQPGEKAQGISRQEMLDVKEAALELINRDESKEYRLTKLMHGFRRTDRLRGTEYLLDLHMTSSDGPASKRVRLLRPFAEPILEGVSTYEDLTIRVNLVMPLAKRFDIFEQFMYRFRKCCIGQKFMDVFLIIVYFGEESREDVENLLAKYRDVFSWNQYKLITVDAPFSRGVGLLKGAEYVRDSVTDRRIMFFCDVDIRFTTAFLQRCQRNPELGKRVYYPVVFSLYNPSLSRSKERSSGQITIKRDSGFWRDFGYGMVCLYVEDFFNVGGFDLSIEGWGGEDVDLHAKFVRSGMDTMRSADEGIFHVWHEKLCQPELSPEQYQSCMNSKISASGSQKQLGNIILEQQERIDQLEKEVEAEKKLLASKGAFNGSMAYGAPLASQLAAAGKEEAKKRQLKIYIYDLPSEFNQKQIEANEEDPPAIWNYDCKTNAYGAEYAIHKGLLVSEFRTENANEADFFYVPVYTSCYSINLLGDGGGDVSAARLHAIRFVRRALEYIRMRYDYFNRSAGRDHVWTFTTDLLDDRSNDLYALLKNGVFFVQSAILANPRFDPHRDVVVPTLIDPDEVVALYSVPFTDRPTRTILAHYSGMRFKSERASRTVSSLVQSIIRQYGHVPRFRIASTRTKTYYLDMMSSIFCLCPIDDGDELSGTQRVYESILLGCIPVLIGIDVELAFADRIDYSKFVLRVRANRIDRLHTILLNVQQKEIIAMRMEMERSWTVVSYHPKVGHVLDNIVYGLVKRKPEQSAKLVYRDR